MLLICIQWTWNFCLCLIIIVRAFQSRSRRSPGRRLRRNLTCRRRQHTLTPSNWPAQTAPPAQTWIEREAALPPTLIVFDSSLSTYIKMYSNVWGLISCEFLYSWLVAVILTTLVTISVVAAYISSCRFLLQLSTTSTHLLSLKDLWISYKVKYA